MKIKTCKTCGKQFLTDYGYPYCRICSRKWREEQDKIREQAENLKWKEYQRQEKEKFESEMPAYSPIPVESIRSSENTLYIIGNGFDLMHRVPSSYYSFRDSLGKKNGLRHDLETALTAEDIWADFENALGTLNYDLMGSSHIVDMWLDNFGFYDDDAGAAEFYMAAEAAAAPISNLVSGLQPAFRRWMERLEVGTDERPLSGLINPQGKVLDFNYTEFIETLYGMKDVCYIHGSRKKKGKLILGHKPGATGSFNEKRGDPKNYRQAAIDVAQDNVFGLIREYDRELTKDSREVIKKHQDFFDGLVSVEQIVVIGHSISPVDWDYFAEVRKKAVNAHWYFGIFGLNDLRNMTELVKCLEIEKYDVFRTDGICTKPNKVVSKKTQHMETVKPRVFREEDVTVTIDRTYEFRINDDFEVVLPEYAKNVVVFPDYIFAVLNDLSESILLFKRQDEGWVYVTALEAFQHQSLLNRRLNHIFYGNDGITFVYNNRVRKYNLAAGNLIVNRQIRDAGSREYLGMDVTKRFLGKKYSRCKNRKYC